MGTTNLGSVEARVSIKKFGVDIFENLLAQKLKEITFS